MPGARGGGRGGGRRGRGEGRGAGRGQGDAPSDAPAEEVQPEAVGGPHVAERGGEAEPNDPNIVWNERVASAVSLIVERFGREIETCDALPMKDGGFAAPVDWRKITKLYGSGVETDFVEGGINALWASPTRTLTPGVPVNEEAVLALMAAWWPDDRPRPFPAVLELQAVPNKPELGQILRLSPEESHQALILQVAKRLEAGADEEETERWRRVLLSVTGRLFVRRRIRSTSM